MGGVWWWNTTRSRKKVCVLCSFCFYYYCLFCVFGRTAEQIYEYSAVITTVFGSHDMVVAVVFISTFLILATDNGNATVSSIYSSISSDVQTYMLLKWFSWIYLLGFGLPLFIRPCKNQLPYFPLSSITINRWLGKFCTSAYAERNVITDSKQLFSFLLNWINSRMVIDMLVYMESSLQPFFKLCSMDIHAQY